MKRPIFQQGLKYRMINKGGSYLRTGLFLSTISNYHGYVYVRPQPGDINFIADKLSWLSSPRDTTGLNRLGLALLFLPTRLNEEWTNCVTTSQRPALLHKYVLIFYCT